MPLDALRRSAPRAAACLVAGAALAGCSGAVTVPSTRSAEPAAATSDVSATVSAPPATLAGGGSSPASPPATGSPADGSAMASAVRSAVGSSSSVRMTMTTPAGRAVALVDLRNRAVRLTVGDGPQAVTLVHANGTTWVRGTGVGGSSRPWLQLRPDGTDVVSRRLGQAVNVEAALRPAAFADLMDGLTGDQTRSDAGSHTSFWVPADRYVQAVRGDSSTAAALTQPVVVAVDLDPRNRPTHLVATMRTGSGTLVDDTVYEAWDQPVAIDVPASSDVALAPQPSSTAEAPQPTGAAGADPTGTPTP